MAISNDRFGGLNTNLGILDNQFGPAASNKVGGTAVSDFLVSQAEVARKAEIPKTEPVQRAEPLRRSMPGPAESLGSQIVESLTDILSSTTAAKNTLKDYAQGVSSVGDGFGMDLSSDDEDSDDSGLQSIVKAARDMNRLQQDRMLKIIDMMDKQSTADMIGKAFKGANASFNKLISG